MTELIRFFRLTLCLVMVVAVSAAASAAPTTAAADLWPAEQPIPISGRAEPKLAAFDELMTSFIRKHQIPGASLAVAKDGLIVYSRGFGYADVAAKEPVTPDALFRIASISKPFTSAAVLQLQEHGKLKLEDPAFKMLGIKPLLEGDAKVDPRLWDITIEQLLHHTGGFDRDKSFDPMFRPIEIAKATSTEAPARPNAIIEYMEGRQLDFDPGTREAYSNYGYCVLGRVIEKITGMQYADYVKKEVLTPLGISRMRIGGSLANQRAPGEVRYYPHGDPQEESVFGKREKVPAAYGSWYIEAMDSHGGWIASAPELVRIASAVNDHEHSPILSAGAVERLLRRTKDTGYDKSGKPKTPYYACGWEVRPNPDGKTTIWHAGLLDGTSTLLVSRHDGLTWAIVFNSDYDDKGHNYSSLIDPMVHPVADGIKQWPEGREFREPANVKE